MVDLLILIKCNKAGYLALYPFNLKMKEEANTVEGIARDTARNVAKEECIVLDIEGEDVLIVLDKVASMTALVDNPHFSSVAFS